MKILSIDTSSNICGVSILEDTNLIYKSDENTGRTHSENLMPMIEKTFKQTHLTLKDIDLFVCDKGPGSFTGIRIGIATIKAFHDSLNIPCVGISSLEALAYSVKQEGFIISLLDCKNDNCYFALYELKNGKYTETLSPRADTIENALKIAKQNLEENTLVTFVGDGCEVYKKRICRAFKNYFLATPENNLLDSYYLGLAGFEKYKNTSSEDILPLYLKKPQAQRQLQEQLKYITITAMTDTDLDQISTTLTSDFDDFWNSDLLKNELQAENSSYLVAKWNENIIGFAGIKILIEEANIMNLVVKKDFRNQGIAGLLLKNLIHLSKEKNLTSITLEVMEENYPAIHLYQNFGFRQIGLRKKYYQDKNGLIMTKPL